MDEKKLLLDPEKGLEDILRQIVYIRFEIYTKHPEIIRMMTWQKLEATKKQLSGGTIYSPNNWKEIFEQLQTKGEVRQDIDIDLMILFITNMISGIAEIFLQTKRANDVENELEIMIQCFIRSFGTNRAQQR
jgi:hypothetical protein